MSRLTPEREREIREVNKHRAVNGLSDVLAGLWEFDPISLLLSEIDRLRAERTWQPMESAPKDGTRVLALYKDGHISFMWWCGGRWCINGKHRTPTFFAAPPNGHGQPIGWMPLPAPPTTEEGTK